jgi:CRP-like cAMP-binding protein
VVHLVQKRHIKIAEVARHKVGADLASAVRTELMAGNPLIRKLERFAVLSEADRALLEQISASPRTVPARTDLVREGDKPEGVFLVLSGFACRHKPARRAGRAWQLPHPV